MRVRNRGRLTRHDSRNAAAAEPAIRMVSASNQSRGRTPIRVPSASTTARIPKESQAVQLTIPVATIPAVDSRTDSMRARQSYHRSTVY